MTLTMPPSGLHGLIGLLIAGRIDSRPGKIGVAWGSVFPDLDLIGSVIAFLLTQDEEFTILVHRSVTHSFIVMGLLLIIGFAIPRLSKKEYPNIIPFISWFVVGMFLHATFDLFYLGGVALFWPIQPFNERVTILDYTFNELSPAYNHLVSKIIASLDGGFESIYFLVFVFLATRYNTDSELIFSIRTKTLTITNWLSKLRWIAFGLIGITIFFIFLAFASISWPYLDRTMFILVLYIPLTPVYLLSGTLAVLMRNTVAKINY